MPSRCQTSARRGVLGRDSELSSGGPSCCIPWPPDPFCSHIHNHKIIFSPASSERLIGCSPLCYITIFLLLFSLKHSSSSSLSSSAAVQRLSGHHVRDGDRLPAPLSARCGRGVEGKEVVLDSGEESHLEPPCNSSKFEKSVKSVKKLSTLFSSICVQYATGMAAASQTIIIKTALSYQDVYQVYVFFLWKWISVVECRASRCLVFPSEARRPRGDQAALHDAPHRHQQGQPDAAVQHSARGEQAKRKKFFILLPFFFVHILHVASVRNSTWMFTNDLIASQCYSQHSSKLLVWSYSISIPHEPMCLNGRKLVPFKVHSEWI